MVDSENNAISFEYMTDFVIDGTPEDIISRYASLPSNAAQADYGEFDTNIVVLDTETTGISLKKDELTQIAAARMNNGEIVDWFVTFVNPGKPIPDDITHLTNIHDEDVADAPTPIEALTKLVEFIGDAKVVAHNAEFDRNFVTKHPAGYPLLENEWIDSLELSRIALPRMRSHRLIDLVKAFKAPLSTHRADEDVEATCSLYRILLAAVNAMPKPLVNEIAKLAPSTEWSTQVVFAYFADDEEGVPFSLKEVRRQRVSKTESRPKRDAAAMVSAELAERANLRFQNDNEDIHKLVFPSKDEIDQMFSADGLLGKIYDDYQSRDEQRLMAQAVRDAFATSENLMVEAGTGVGKSMAYLAPAALIASRNDINIGVATKTNALLDQLVYHELPALSKAMDGNLTYAALKGFTHYPCLRKVQNIYSEGAKMRTVQNEEKTQAPAIAALLSFIEQTEYDDLDQLKIDFRLLPRRAVSTTGHDCLRRKCPFYGASCFVHGQRRRAEAADIVVTNQSLLFCDVAADGGLLPPIRYWVIDEAHSAQDEARSALSLELSADNLNMLASRVSANSSARNIFQRAERVYVPENPDKPEAAEAATLFFGLLEKARKAGEAFALAEADLTSHFRDLLYFDTQKHSSYEYTDLWINQQVRESQVFQQLEQLGRVFSDSAEKLVSACQELVGFLEVEPKAAAVQRELAATAYELKDAIHAAEEILFKGDDMYVYSATLCRRADKGGNVLQAQLYNVGSKLDETLYANTHSIVFTSATLTVAGSFNSFEEAMGLNTSEQSHARSLVLDSNYDFDANMTVYVINDLPEPTSQSYLPQIQQMLTDAHLAQGGSMLTLFTNRKEMEACFAEVSPHLKEENLRLVCQKWGVSSKTLRDDFLKDETLSLFALKSFWEGFDAPGNTLRGVIIPKLPFQKPSDPLSCERARRDDAAWRNYVLPRAVLEVKQAAGRLIRKADDEGVLILADSRLVSKGYGKVFLRSLPSRNIHILTSAEMLEELSLIGRV